MLIVMIYFQCWWVTGWWTVHRGSNWDSRRNSIRKNSGY